MLYFYIFCFILSLIGMLTPPFDFTTVLCMVGFCASLYGIIRYCVENADGDDEDDDYDYEPTEHDLYKEKDWRD